MGYAKNYHLRLLETCAPENGSAQEAIELTAVTGLVAGLFGEFEIEPPSAQNHQRKPAVKIFA